MSKTIKQFADELRVSKQAVFKKIKQPPLSTSLQGLTATVDGRLTVSVDGEKLVKQALLRAEPSTKVNWVADNQFTPVDGAVVGIMEVLKEQLTAKDRQIEQQQQSIKELTAALENTTLSLKAAQALHAGTMHQQFESLPPISGEPLNEQQANPPAEPEQKQGIFSRLFWKGRL